MAEVSETLVDLEPSGDLDRGTETTGQPSAGAEALAEPSATLQNSGRGRRPPMPDESLSFLRIWGSRWGVFINGLLTTLEEAALLPHVLDYKWSDRANQREVLLKVSTSGAPLVKYALGKFAKDSGCRISWSVPFHDREARRKDRGFTEPKDKREITHPRFVSWNVRGFAAKKVEIRVSLDRLQAVVVGLQETNMAEDGWQLRIPGFRVFSRPGTNLDRNGYRGVALAVSKRLTSFEVGPYNRLWVCAKVLGLCQGDAWYVINVYRSHRRELKHEFTKLVDYISRLREREADARIVVMGDFNWEPHRLHTGILRPCGLIRVPFKGSDKSFFGGGGRGRDRWTAIDHFLVSGNTLGLVSKAQVRRGYSASDHFPISLKVRRPAERTGEDQEERGPKRKLLSRDRLREAKDKAASHPEWEKPEFNVPRPGELDIEGFVKRFTESSDRVIAELRLLKDPIRNQKIGLPKSVKRALKAKRKAWKRYLQAGIEQAPELFRAYRLRRREAKLAIKEERERGWAEFVDKGSRFLREGDSKQFFRWAKRTIEGGNSSVISPLKDAEGVIHSPWWPSFSV
jgi:exonuclease III